MQDVYIEKIKNSIELIKITDITVLLTAIMALQDIGNLDIITIIELITIGLETITLIIMITELIITGIAIGKVIDGISIVG